MAITEELLHDVFTALGNMPPSPSDPLWGEWVGGIKQLVIEAVKPAAMTIQFYEEDGTVDISFTDGRNIVLTCDEAWRAATHLVSELKKQRPADPLDTNGVVREAHVTSAPVENL